MLVENDISIFHALRRISTLTDAACATLATLEAHADSPLLAYLDDLIPDEASATTLRNTAGDIVARVTAAKAPVCSNNLTGEFSTIAGFPITLRSGLNTTFLLGWQEAKIPALDLKAMSALVEMLALVVDAHLAYYAEQHYVQSLEYLGNFSTELNVFSDLPSMVRRAAHTAAVLLNTKRYVLYLEKEQLPDQVYFDGISADFAYWFAEVALAIDILKYESSAVGIEYTRIITTTTKDLPDTWRVLLQKEGVQSSLVTVLHSSNQIFGSLWIIPRSSVYTHRL